MRWVDVTAEAKPIVDADYDLLMAIGAMLDGGRSVDEETVARMATIAGGK